MNVKGLRKEIEELTNFSKLLKEFESSLGSGVDVTKVRLTFVSLNSIKDVVDMLDVLSYNLGVIIIKKLKKEDDRVSKMLSKLKDDEISFSVIKKDLVSYFKSLEELKKFGDVSKLLSYGKNVERISSELEKDFEEV